MIESADQAFHHYVAALADDETGDAAEIYANWIDNEEFNKLVSVFDSVWSLFDQGEISIELEDEPPNSIMEE